MAQVLDESVLANEALGNARSNDERGSELLLVVKQLSCSFTSRYFIKSVRLSILIALNW